MFDLNCIFMLVNNTVFLCGYFSAKRSLNTSVLGAWTREERSQSARDELSNYYLPEFASFMMDKIAYYTKAVDKTCALHFSDTEEASFDVVRLHLWSAPFNLILFAVEIDMKCIEFNLMTKTLNSLRNCVYYSEMHTAFIEAALGPMVKLYNQVTDSELSLNDNLTDLIENGNKFKLFQAVTPTEPVAEDDIDYLLFDTGTLARHTPNSTGMNAFDYYQSIMEKHRISVFNGWKGLALLDTFTMLSIDTPEWVVNNWKTDYFGMIFVYQLFRKVFLYNVNTRYRKRTEDVEVLESQLEQFEKDFCFGSVSYNFLPNIINDAIGNSFDTDNDSRQIYQMINNEMEKRRQHAEERTNKFLTFLTVMTMFSAIFDFTCLIDNAFDFSLLFGDGKAGYRFISLGLMIVVVAVYVLIILRQRKKQ